MKPKNIFFQSFHLVFNSLYLPIIVNFLLTSSILGSGKWSTVVDLYGDLKVKGNKIVDKNGKPAALRGMSFFWSQWMDKYYNYDCVKWLRDDWKCNVVRAAMGVEYNGYLLNPEREMKKIKTIIEACIDLGIYVIIDWHSHNAHKHEAEVIAFFREIAALYGDKPNIIYEIFNEPTKMSWTEIVKPYSETVVKEIRSIDPDNIIILGTPTWSQDVDVASRDPLEYENIVYSLHFYAATHKQYLRDKAIEALNNGAALFISEYGTCEHTGNGIIDYQEVKKWFNFMDEYNLSWCNWSVSDKDETASILKRSASPTGIWSIDDLSESGRLIREQIILSNELIFNSLKEVE